MTQDALERPQSADVWEPVAWRDPPAPPSMARRVAEEQALEMAAMQGHGRSDGRARKLRPRRTVDIGGSMARWYMVRHSPLRSRTGTPQPRRRQMRSLRTAHHERKIPRPGLDYLIEASTPSEPLSQAADVARDSCCRLWRTETIRRPFCSQSMSTRRRTRSDVPSTSCA